MEARDVPGADEKGEQTKEVPNEGALTTPGKHFYVAGDKVSGLVHYINARGAYLDHGEMTVLIPAEGKDTPLFKVGDCVNAEVKRVEEDGTVILDTYLVLEEDEEDSSSTLRKWKDSGWGVWWKDSWCAGQWYQDSDGQWVWKSEEWQSYEWFADQGLSSEEREESFQKQLCGEKIYRVLLEDAKAEKAYLGKITGMLLSRRMDEVKEFVADPALMENEARQAYNTLCSEGWTPDGTEDAGLGKITTFPRKQYRNVLYDLARQKRRYSEAVVGEAVAMLLDQGGDELWNELWLDTKQFLQELDGAVESMSAKAKKPMEAYMDLDKCRKVYMTPRTVSPGYTKLCKFYNQGRCRNGSECSYEHRRPGDGWPERGPTEPGNSQKVGDEDGDIGSPPIDEGTVDEAQQEREDSAFRAQCNYGKGASKGEPVSVEPKKQMCLYYNQGGCRFGNACRYIHDDKAVLEGTWEPGKSWDNASRKSIRDEGFHHCCFDYYLKGRCRVRFGCRFSHDEMSEERLTRLKYLANVANQVRFQNERGLEIPDRSTFQPPAIGGAESSSSSAPQALQMTNVSKKAGEVDTLDGAEGDVQKDSVAESTTVRLQNPEEPIEQWMARNQHLWVYTPHVSDVMIKLGVTNVKELQVNKVTACKILELVGGVCYRPMSPDVAVSTNASVRMERSSGSREAGRDVVRTSVKLRCCEGPIERFSTKASTVTLGRLRRGLRCVCRGCSWWGLECHR